MKNNQVSCPDDCHDAIASDMLPTPPSTNISRSSSPDVPDVPLNDPETQAESKKKKKKKAKKSTKAKDSAAGGKGAGADRDRPPVLCISRNKHWRYISSYHVRRRRRNPLRLYRLTQAHRGRGCNSRSSCSIHSSSSTLTLQHSMPRTRDYLPCPRILRPLSPGSVTAGLRASETTPRPTPRETLSPHCLRHLRSLPRAQGRQRPLQSTPAYSAPSHISGD